ncbi:MAG: PKD domain-containing protein [Planctomycetales bacterium]|nr:PKD domain-containing protein [Planctomycetales bacterium]
MRAWVCLVWLMSSGIAAQAEAPPAPWHLAEWSARAVVEIKPPLAGADVDTAAARVLCQGQTKPSGEDVRVLDVAGQPVPFQLTWHDAGRYSWIAFRVANPQAGQRYFVYFGNPQASRATEQVVDSPTPGAGPPQGSWIPRAGLVFGTVERPRQSGPAAEQPDDNPKTVDELAKMLAASPRKLGARYQHNISDGFNPFGSSDYYMSLYRGWIKIPAAGKYQFCTASNEASFSFLDGKELIHWPGRHTEERGLRGEKNALVELTAGLHYIEYYHEEVTLQQVAFLGWRPSADQGPFSGIPDEVFTRPHTADVLSYEQRGGPALLFEPQIVDSIWPLDRHEGQYTRVRFRLSPASHFPEGTTFHWTFGDGLSLESRLQPSVSKPPEGGTPARSQLSKVGHEVEHVYLTLGVHDVTMTAEQPGQPPLVTKWPLDVYEIQHAADQFPDGKPGDYATIVRTYDRSKLDAPRLKEFVHLLAEAAAWSDAKQAGGEFVQRFGAASPTPVVRGSPDPAPKPTAGLPKSGDLRSNSVARSGDRATTDLAQIRRLIAEAALQLGEGNLQEAVDNYRASLTEQTPLPERLNVLAKLVRLMGIDRDLPEEAGKVIADVEAAVRGKRLDDDSRQAYRDAIIAAGDVLLWHGKRDGSVDLYRKAEGLSSQFIPPQVRSARIGAYPNSIREYIHDGNHGAALDLVAKWESSFPTDKVRGHTFFWRGKLHSLRNEPKPAARYLARSIGLGLGADFESEARWLLSIALDQLGRPDDSRRELAKLVASGLKDEFVEKAKEKLRATKK